MNPILASLITPDAFVEKFAGWALAIVAVIIIGGGLLKYVIDEFFD